MRSHLLPATAAVAALSLVAGCHAGGSSAPQPGQTVNTEITKHPSPKPTKTIVRGFRTLRSGEAERLQAANGAAMVIKVSGPSVSTTRLSSSYGYPPEHGYYVTFKIRIKDVGPTPIVIQRLDFWVRSSGLGKITTNDGAAPYSGSPSQLDTTEITHGESVSNNLTFDVARPSGTVYYGPGGKRPTVAWRFSGH